MPREAPVMNRVLPCSVLICRRGTRKQEVGAKDFNTGNHGEAGGHGEFLWKVFSVL